MELRQWPADRPERRPVAQLRPFPRNARLHSPEQIAQVAASITQWGWTNAVLVDQDDEIIAGHARVLAAQSLGLPEVPVIVARDWSIDEKRAYVIADNQLALNASWDSSLLSIELNDLKSLGFDYRLTGFSELDLAELDDELAQADDVGTTSGELLSLVNITIAEPKHTVELFDTWRLGRHWLHCCSVLTGFRDWMPSLGSVDNAIFCPFPSPLVALGLKAADHVLVLVQPDPYVAGHCIDRYAEVHGDDSVVRSGNTKPASS